MKDTQRNRQAPTGPLFSFGIIADCQYADIPDMTTFADRRFRLSLQKLRHVAEFFNAKDLQFVVHLGDAIDQDISSFDTIMPVFGRMRAPVLHVLGNHDFSATGGTGQIDRHEVLRKLGLDHPYYSSIVMGWRFIVVDGNEVGVIEYPEGSKEYAKGKALLETLIRAGRVNAQTWNGALGQEQVDWLMSELEEAEKSGQQVVIFSHQSIYPKHRENILNDEELLPRLARYKNLKAFINGHNHDGNYGQYGHLHCVTMHGMVDTAENAYALAHVHDDRIEIEGYGRELSRTLRL